MSVSVAPKSSSIGRRNKEASAPMKSPAAASIHSAVPRVSLACGISLRPTARLKQAAPPMPTRAASAVTMEDSGRAMFGTASASAPTPCPMKSWSTTL